MNRPRISSAVLAAVLAAAASAQQPVAVEASFKVADAKTPAPLALPSESLTLAKEAPAAFTTPGDCADPWYGQYTVGGKKVTFVVGKSKADVAQPDQLLADLDGDGRIADNERIALAVKPIEGRNNQPSPGAQGEADEFTVAVGAQKVPVKARFLHLGDRPPTLNLTLTGYLEAKVKIGDEDWVVAVLDKDLDGKYGGTADQWTLAMPGKKGFRPTTAFGLSALTERCFANGQLVGITVDQGRTPTVRVSMTPATGPDPKDAAAHRARVEHVWSERFDKERDQFVEQRKMDTTRAKAKDPVHWNYVTFDEALALSKKTGKPAFVDVMAFWCVWCYRMDYYTYPDAQVAELLNSSFVPVKIIQEQDAAGDYDRVMKDKLAANGIPAMGIFDADGNALHKIGGWKKPEEFVAELQKGLDAAKK